MAGVTRSIDVMFVRVPEQLDGDYHIMATARDITERDEIEERLRRERLLFELIIESTSEGIIVVDNQLRHVIWNAAMERINGQPRSVVLGKTVFEVFPEFDQSSDRGCLARSAEWTSGRDAGLSFLLARPRR